MHAASAARPAYRGFPDLATALTELIPDDARVIGFGELHSRSDRPTATSSLDAFTQAMPAIAERLSDLVIETWRVDPKCGNRAVQATARLESTMQRPAQTKTEVRSLADIARLAGIQLHAMTLTCADYARIAPDAPTSGTPTVDAIAMLDLTTRELARIATSAVAHRDAEPHHRPWIAVYGGAIHNDRFPEPAVADWSYAPAVDAATDQHFIELDLIVPALAAADAASQRQPWFPLVTAPRDPGEPVIAWQRGLRSFVILLAP